jgi:arginine-tRNA-protein transferase
MPFRAITLEDADRRLALGHRRTGEFVYQTNCPACKACQPIRIETTQFRFSRNHRRTIRRGDLRFHQQIGELVADSARVDLFNKHRQVRGLAKRDADIDIDEYAWGFVRSCFQSFEIGYYLDHQLACIAVCDLGKESLSAVYTFYDPDLRSDSLGTYSILKQIELCQQRGLKFLYLGYFVAQCENMKYKARFLPNERLIDGQWVKFYSGGATFA